MLNMLEDVEDIGKDVEDVGKEVEDVRRFVAGKCP